jgi:hypothetical protein
LVLGAVTVTVTLSVIFHGVTSSPLAERYGRITHHLPPDKPEHKPAPALPARRSTNEHLARWYRKLP